jgi:hypothetical protein
MCATFSVVNFECPAFYCNAAQQHAFSRTRKGLQNGVVWYVRFKQRAAIEFLVTEKELVTNIHKRLESSYVVNAVDKSSLGFMNCGF